MGAMEEYGKMTDHHSQSYFFRDDTNIVNVTDSSAQAMSKHPSQNDMPSLAKANSKFTNDFQSPYPVKLNEIKEAFSGFTL